MSEQHLVCPYCGRTSRVDVPEPNFDTVPEGNDIIGGPVAGLPDNEDLSRLVADANLTTDTE